MPRPADTPEGCRHLSYLLPLLEIAANKTYTPFTSMELTGFFLEVEKEQSEQLHRAPAELSKCCLRILAVLARDSQLSYLCIRAPSPHPT